MRVYTCVYVCNFVCVCVRVCSHFASPACVSLLYVAPFVHLSGPTQGVSISRQAAAFVSEDGHIDIFNGRTLCWTSYKVGGAATGMLESCYSTHLDVPQRD